MGLLVRHSNQRSWSLSRQQGMTLIELLVVVVILTIGILGVASLQVVSLKHANNSALQTQAMLLTQDMIDRIKANRAAVTSSSGTLTDKAYRKGPGGGFPSSGDANCLGGHPKGCDAAAMAKTDLYLWSQLIRHALPVDTDVLNNEVLVCLDSDPAYSRRCDGTGSTFLIQLAWRDKASWIKTSTTDDEIQVFRIAFEP